MSEKKDVSRDISGLLLAVLVLLLGLSLCRQWLPVFSPGLTVLVYLAVYLLPMLIYVKGHRYKGRKALRLKMVHPKYWLFILLFGVSVCIICTLLQAGMSAFGRLVLHTEFQNSIVDLSGMGTGTLVFTTVLLPAFAEELLLRGLVQGEYEKCGVTIGVLLTALLFALFHTNPLQIPALFVAGCCYGVPTSSFLGVVYPEGGFAPAGIPLVPVQLFETAGDLLLFGALCLPVYRQPGRRLAAYLLGYGCLRFATECFRGDAARGLAGPLSGAQWISLACIAAGVIITSYLCLRPRIRGRSQAG